MGGLTATASSVEGPQFLPAYAVDGSLNTRWSSAFSDSQSITLDLGVSKAIAQVVLRWETAYAKTYDLMVSDNGIVFDQVVRVNKTNANPDSINVYRTARYVRMQGIARATQWGYSLFELEVFPCARVPLP
jgi:hyaluronoglucosaminidase